MTICRKVAGDDAANAVIGVAALLYRLAIDRSDGGYGKAGREVQWKGKRAAPEIPAAIEEVTRDPQVSKVEFTSR